MGWLCSFFVFPAKEINYPEANNGSRKAGSTMKNRNDMAHAADLRRFHPFAAGELISRMLCAGAVYFFFSLYILNAAAS